MNWAVFAVAAVVGLVLDQALLDALALDPASRQIRPSLCAALAVFVALSAPRFPALWACYLLGLLLDLSSPLVLGGSGVFHLVGPWALGYTAGAWILLRTRRSLLRQRPLTLGAMTVVFLLAVHAVAVAVYVVRSFHPGPELSWASGGLAAEIGRRLLVSLYCGLVAVPAGWLLLRTVPLWRFQTAERQAPAR